MKIKQFSYLLAAGVIALVLSFGLNDPFSEPAAQSWLEGFADQVDAIHTITIEDDVNKLALKRGEQEWLLASRHDYPADMGKLRTLVSDLVDARLFEKKTAKAESLPKLGLAEPGAGEGSAVSLKLIGDGVQYAILIGKKAATGGRYVRFADSTQSWLLDRNIQLPAETGEWLEPGFLDIEGEHWRRVEIITEAGTVKLNKASRDEQGFVLEGIPAGKKLAYDGVTNAIGGAFDALRFEDVLPLSALGRESMESTARFTAWNGFVLQVEIYEQDGKWVRFKAEYPPESETDTKESSWLQDVRVLSGKLAKFAYRLPSYKLGLLQKNMDDFTEEKTDKEESE